MRRAQDVSSDIQALVKLIELLPNKAIEKNLPLSELIDKARVDYFNGERLLHVVIDLYAETQIESEKTLLEAQLYHLLECGADPNVKRRCRDQADDGCPALHRVIKMRASRLVNIILNSDRLDFSVMQYDGYLTAAQVCMELWPDNVDLVRYLSDRNNHELQNLFLEALSYKDKEKNGYLIRNLLVDINVPDEEGRMPLHLLCLQGDIDFIQSVISVVESAGMQFDFALTDGYGHFPLFYACHRYTETSIPIIEWLIANHSPINEPYGNGDYPLHQAVEVSSSAVECLLQRGADPACRDSLGRTPLGKILTSNTIPNDTKMIALLLAADPNTPPIEMPDDIDPLQMSYEEGFWIRVIGADANTIDRATDREVDILQRREGIKDKHLNGHYPHLNVEDRPEYYFSPATFVKKNIPINLFGMAGKFALVIQTPRAIPIWCSGLAGQVMTNEGSDIDFTARELAFNNYNRNHWVKERSSVEISAMLSRLIQGEIPRAAAHECYDYCTNSLSFIYNEGLLRYKQEHISAIVVADSSKSAYFALQFCSALTLDDLPFCTYSSREGITHLSEDHVLALAEAYDPNAADYPDYGRMFALGYADGASTSGAAGVSNDGLVP